MATTVAVNWSQPTWRQLLAAKVRIELATLRAAWLDRSRELEAESAAAILSGRILCTQPAMANPSAPGYRSQPRDGRGRLLSKAWLRQAETFTAADLAWFRSAPEGK